MVLDGQVELVWVLDLSYLYDGLVRAWRGRWRTCLFGDGIGEVLYVVLKLAQGSEEVIKVAWTLFLRYCLVQSQREGGRARLVCPWILPARTPSSCPLHRVSVLAHEYREWMGLTSSS